MSGLNRFLSFNFDLKMIYRNVAISKLLGERLRQVRISKGLTQEQLWLESGIAISQIGKIERGVANPTISTVAALAKTLKVSFDTLIPPDSFIV